jgi:hypothetical protein
LSCCYVVRGGVDGESVVIGGIVVVVVLSTNGEDGGGGGGGGRWGHHNSAQPCSHHRPIPNGTLTPYCWETDDRR